MIHLVVPSFAQRMVFQMVKTSTYMYSSSGMGSQISKIVHIYHTNQLQTKKSVKITRSVKLSRVAVCTSTSTSTSTDDDIETFIPFSRP
jgi:hypothetical protein